MKHYLLLIVALLGTTLSVLAQCPDNEIWYSTVDGEKLDLGSQQGIVSHTYMDASGVIRFDHDIEIVSSERSDSGENYIYFTNCKNLKNITLPNSVKEIGYKAFAGCEQLQTIILPEEITKLGENAFDGCSSLQSVTIPTGIEYIGGRAFRNCVALQSITLPNGIEFIRDGAFEGCTNLKAFHSEYASADGKSLIVNGTLTAFALGSGITEYVIPDEVTRIGRSTFDGYTLLQSVIIPEGVTEIRSNAFRGCNNLIGAVIPNSVTAIGENAFAGCSNLLRVNIPEGVSEIKAGTFRGCSSIQEVTIPRSVDYIWDGAFSGCHNLREFSGAFVSEDGYSVIVNGSLKAFAVNCGVVEYSIPNSVTKIGEDAFDGCTTLQSIVMTDSVTEIKDGAFRNCTELLNIVIPDSVIKMGDQVLNGCSKLESVTISKGLKKIDKNILFGCNSLKSINGNFASADGCALVVDGVLAAYAMGCGATEYTIPEGVIEIGENVFYGCNDLQSITISESVESIHKNAFANCNNLTSIMISESVKEIDGDAFRDCKNLKSAVLLGGGNWQMKPFCLAKIDIDDHFTTSPTEFARILSSNDLPISLGLNAYIRFYLYR
jgi:hypothetical protein